MKTQYRVLIITLALWLGGCTAEFTAHYPGGWNAIDTHESARTVYRGGGYQPPFPMDPPLDPWYKGADLGLRND